MNASLAGRRKVQAVGIPGELFGRDRHEFGVVMAKGQDTGAGEEVNEDIAVEVADEAAVRGVDGNRQVPRVGAGAGLVAILAGQQFGRPRTGKFTGDMRAGRSGDAPENCHVILRVGSCAADPATNELANAMKPDRVQLATDFTLAGRQEEWVFPKAHRSRARRSWYCNYRSTC